MSDTPLQIAIDGPVASGKGEIAARLARKLKLLYIYTGAMYRALALACIEKGVSLKDESYILALLEQIEIAMKEPDKQSNYPYCVLLDGKDVTERIIKPDTAQGASDVGTLVGVRRWMVVRQQELSRGKRVVMEGRDIALRVLPEAQLKIYLTASVEERAKRRWAQWQQKGVQKTYEETLATMRERDAQDMNRAADPLRKVEDAWELDTTGMSADQVVSSIEEELKRRNLI